MTTSEINRNGIELTIHSYDNDVDKKRYIDVYTNNPKNKMFIHQSLKTCKNLRVSLHIEDTIFQLSEKYDYITTLDIFTTLINKIDK
jgi:hypothetical protein